MEPKQRKLPDLINDERLWVTKQENLELSEDELKELWKYRYESFTYFIEAFLMPLQIEISPTTHNTTHLPVGIPFLFLPSSQLQDLFGAMSATIKLFMQPGYGRVARFINYPDSAISFHFYQKHKYFVAKKPKKLDVLERMNTMLESNKVTDQDKEQIMKLIKDIDKYEFAISNYYRFYRYFTVSYKFLTDHKDRKSTKASQRHLSAKRLNILTVDEKLLAEKTGYKNKLVEAFLKGFPIEINSYPTESIYARLK